MSAHGAASPAASVERRPASSSAGPLRGWRRHARDGPGRAAQAPPRPPRHFTRSVQPLLWLFIFGTALRHNRSLTLGTLDYRAYIAPGVMAQAAMFIAIFFGLAVIWERDVGQLQRLLATPLPRAAIVLGKAAGACVRALVQAILLLAVLAVAGIARALDNRRRDRHAGDADARDSRVCVHVDAARGRGQGARALHGHRPADDDATVLRLFRALSAERDARMAARDRARQPLTYEVQGLRQMLVGVGGSGELWLDFLVVIAFFARDAARRHTRLSKSDPLTARARSL